MQSTPPYQSKLVPHEKEILRMWYHERTTLKAIQTWLLEQEIQMTLSGISGFIRRRKNGNDPHEKILLSIQFRDRHQKLSNRQEALDRLDELMIKHTKYIRLCRQ